MTGDFTLEQQQAMAMAAARQRMASAQPQPSQNTPNDGLGLANQAANMGLAYANARSFGIVPKVESAIGAGMAYPVVAAGKAIEGRPIPSYNDLYKMGVNGVQSRVAQSESDNPWLTAGAELAGSIKTGNDLGATKAGQAVGGWVRGAPVAAGAGWGAKAANLLTTAGKSGLVGEAGYRAYKIGNAAPGDEANAAVSGAPVGGIIGASAPILGAAANKIGSALTPSIDAAKAPLVALAQKYNIPLGMDDLSDSPFYKTLISEGQNLPFAGSGSSNKAQQEAFNAAIAKSMGQDAKNITPEVIQKAYDELGDKFDGFVSGKRFPVTPDFYSAIDDITNKASVGDYGADGAQFLHQNLQRVKDIIDDNGAGAESIKGENLDRLRREFAQAYRTGSDGVAGLKGDLEDLLVKQITGGSQAEQDAITNAKYQYKNLKTIQPLALKDQVNGNISPALLTQAVSRNYGQTALAKGDAGELGDLARVGQAIKPAIPNSGTSQRTMARNLLTGDIAAMAPAYIAGGPLAVAAQGVATAGGLGINRALQNRNVNQKLMMQLLQNKGGVPVPLLSSAVSGGIGQQMAKLLQ